MAHGQRTLGAVEGAAAGAAAGPVGAAVGAIGGYVGALFGEKSKPKAPPKPKTWFTPVHVAIVAGAVGGGLLLFFALKKK